MSAMENIKQRAARRRQMAVDLRAANPKITLREIAAALGVSRPETARVLLIQGTCRAERRAKAARTNARIDAMTEDDVRNVVFPGESGTPESFAAEPQFGRRNGRTRERFYEDPNGRESRNVW